MKLSKDLIQKMVGAGSGSSAYFGGGSLGVSKTWVEENYLSKEFFNRLFTIHGTVTGTDPETGDEVTTDVIITPNDTSTDVNNIQARFGLWTNSFLSALGLNSGGGGGGSSTLADLLDVQLTNPANGQVLIYNSTLAKWVNGQVSGTVTSITAGTGLSGGTITSSGTIAINSTYQSYISHGQTAYGWGNHAKAGYATQDWVREQGYMTSAVNSITAGTGLSGGTITSSGTIAINSTYQSYISHGQTAYGWGNHANAGYLTASSLNGYATQEWVQSQGYLTSSSFSAFSAVDEKLSITIGSTTRTAQAPTIADLGVNAEAASSSSVPSSKFPGVKLGTKTGLYMTRLYDTSTPPSATPVNYGNIINIIGGGGGQILAQWQGSYDTGHLFYRSHRDTTASGGWTPWKKIAFTDDAVAAADKLSTARTLWGQSFNGTANVTGNMTSVGSIAASGEIKTSNGNAFRLSYGNVGTILRSDSTSFHVLFTDSGSADAGTWNTLRPLSIEKASGHVRMENGLWIYNANQPIYGSSGFNALRIGNAVLSWDSSNNSLKVSKYDGTAVNFYSLGGVSALGFQAGSSSTSITNLTVTDTLTASNVNVGSSDFSIAPYTYNSTTGLAITSVRRVKIEGDNVWLNGAYVDSNSFFHSPRFYFDATHYLRYFDNHLQFYNGSSFINLT